MAEVVYKQLLEADVQPMSINSCHAAQLKPFSLVQGFESRPVKSKKKIKNKK